MVFVVYIVRCADGSYYTGHTDDLVLRISKHQSGELGGYTARRRPIDLVFSQECGSRDSAIAVERQLKGWRRAKKEALIRGDVNALRQLARGHTREPIRPPR